MDENDGKQEQSGNASQSPPPTPQDQPASRYKQDQRSSYNAGKQIREFFRLSVTWLNRHEGSVNAFSALVTGISTGVIAWLTSSIATDSGRQAEIIGNQLKLLQLDERPWVSVDTLPSAAAPIFAITDDILLTGARIHVKNVGKSPARRVKVYGRLITEHIAAVDGLFRSQKRICDPLREGGSLPAGVSNFEFTIFPNQTFDINVDLSNENNMADPHILKDVIYIAVGCIDYQFMGQPEHHQTGFVYDIRRNDNMPIVLKKGQEIAASNFRFLLDFAGTGPAD